MPDAKSSFYPLSFTLYHNPKSLIVNPAFDFHLNPEYTRCVAQVLLAGKDWQARALLRAQLIDEGVSVEAYETVEEALAQLELSSVLPALLIADISASDHPSADVERLTIWAKRIPIWIIASHTLSVEGGLEGHGFETLLFRPVDMGKLVQQIQQRLSR
jgi:CheY-like chemotaxis protein